MAVYCVVQLISYGPDKLHRLRNITSAGLLLSFEILLVRKVDDHSALETGVAVTVFDYLLELNLN